MVTNDDIREVFLANGFTIKDGLTDLKPYVYEAARALLAKAEEKALIVGWKFSWIQETIGVQHDIGLSARDSAWHWSEDCEHICRAPVGIVGAVQTFDRATGEWKEVK